MWNRNRITIVLIAVAACGLLLYYKFGAAPKTPPAAPTSTTSLNVKSNVIPVMVSGTVPASSYGKAAVGSKTATSVTLSAPISSAELGTLLGAAKPSPGKPIPNFTKTKIALYDPKTNKLLTSTALAANGSYKFIVEPGEYILNLMPGTGALKSDQLPQRIYVGVGDVVNVNFFVH